MKELAIEAKNVTKFYGKRRGVLDLTFSVQNGEIFGFLGPNGAGKTTVIRLFMDFIRPSEGSINIFGLDSRIKSLEIKKIVGYLPGELHLYEYLDGRTLLKYFAGFRTNLEWGYVESLALRLKADLNQPIRKLSYGNKQKIGLIAAFMHKPRLLLLDEPTMGLDPLVQNEFYDLLREVRLSGSTVFMSSHNLSEVEKVCDKVAVIREGRLVVVEGVGDLRKKAMKNLEVHFANPVKKSDFEVVEGIVDLEVENNVLRCKVIGSLDSMIKKLAQYKVINIESETPSLEEIFLRFYSDGK